MICRQIDTCRRCSPVPISFLINAATRFDCDIFIRCENILINVKNYDEMIGNLKTRGKTLMFFFNGTDELDAQQRIERIFHE